VLICEAAAKCIPPFPVEEALVKVESAWKYPLDFPLSDLGNAERLVFQYGSGFRYCTNSKKYLIWNGKQWTPDDKGQVYLFAKEVVRAMPGEAKAAKDEEQRKKLLKHALSTEFESRLRAMVNLTQILPGICIGAAQLDADPWLLNVRNGLLDLKTGDLKPHDSTELVTKIVPVPYEPDAVCPLWNDFLDRIMAGNKDLIAFLKRAVGYALTGDTGEQCLFFLHGKGANGKSTFLETVKTLLNDYAKQADFNTLLTQSSNGPRNDIACLAGARLVTASEVEAGKKLAEVVVKQLTGGDTILTRFLYAEYFEFRPTFKLFLAGNHKPTVSGTDDAIWRRIKLIPFMVTIPEKDRDPELKTKLEKELPGILRWAVEGCLEWQRTGLRAPAEVKAATAGYRAEMDTITGFIDEWCVISPEAKVKSSFLYERFMVWCSETGEEVVSPKIFGSRLKELFTRERVSKGIYYSGIGLKDDE
jgi:putative DNA primase/helicase